jgi:hypothetical protein
MAPKYEQSFTGGQSLREAGAGGRLQEDGARVGRGSAVDRHRRAVAVALVKCALLAPGLRHTQKARPAEERERIVLVPEEMESCTRK